MSTFADILREHVGHRAVLRDERHLRCVDCNRTVVLPSPAASAGPTSTSPAPPKAHERCPLHLNGYRGFCVGCAADAKAAHDDDPLPPDAPSGVEAARAALAALRAKERP